MTSINGNLKKNAVFAVFVGLALAILLIAGTVTFYNIAFSPSKEPATPNLPINTKKIGERIATRMATSEPDIAFIWSSNNTWVNSNLSIDYSTYVDAISIGKAGESLQMALIHKPEARLADVNQQELNGVTENFRSAIAGLNKTSNQYTSIDDIFPLTLFMDIAYENGTSLSLVYAKEENVIGIVNGTWEESDGTMWGINILLFSYYYNNNDMIFLEVPDSKPFLDAMREFENFVLNSIAPT
ncbi:MAG: hypothetical protein ACFFCQ_02705 [Promethearchaeota archaeon]